MEGWYAVVSGKVTGPFNKNAVDEMINRKEIVPGTFLFCKSVTVDWTEARKLQIFSNLFDAKPIYIPSKKNPVVAAILSFLLCGLGQFYNEEIPKGIVFLLVGLLGMIGGIFLMGTSYILVMVISVIDAYISAERLNQKNIQLERTSMEQRDVLRKTAPAVIRERELWDEERIKNELQGLCKLKAQSIIDENEFNSEMTKVLRKMMEYGKSGDKYSTLSYFNNLRKDNLLREQDMVELKKNLLD